MTNHELKLKAAGINFAVFTISDLITKDLQKVVKELNNLKQEDINKIFFIVSYVTLFKAQKYFWEQYIKDKESATIFEKYLFQMFEKTAGVNPEPFIKDLVDYVQKGDPSREVQYIGSKICRELKREDAILMMEIVAIYSTFLLNVFFESMKKAWELPNETLEEMLERIK